MSTFFSFLRLKDHVLRQRYLLAHLLCWMIIGTLFAAVMSLAGSSFYGFVETGPDPFASLMALLNDQNKQLIAAGGWIEVWPLKLQTALWNQYVDAEISVGSGISAMPSIHVSIAVLMALGIQKVNWKLGTFFWINALVIQVGSVHLGWHYAIDGYVAAILTIIVWKVSGRLVERFSPNNVFPA